jgi:hypothetical protein
MQAQLLHIYYDEIEELNDIIGKSIEIGIKKTA